MKNIIGSIVITLSLVLVGCGAPEPNAGYIPGIIHEQLSFPPARCDQGQTCPTGQLCADDGTCEKPCGNGTTVCNFGWHCFVHGTPRETYDCLPNTSCIYADGGCQ